VTRSFALAVIVVALAADARGAPNAACSVALTPFDALGVEADERYVVTIVSEALATEVASATGCSVITEKDVVAMLDYEAKKQECGQASDSCMAEIGSALGVDFLVAGSVARLEDGFTIHARLVDIERAVVVARAEESAQRASSELSRAARNAGRALFRLPPVERDEGDVEASLVSRVLWYAGFATAGLALLGVVVGAGLAAGSYLVTQQATAPGNVKALAVPVVFVGAAGATVALVFVPAGLAVAGLGYVFE
jgi:TolB-like protein